MWDMLNLRRLLGATQHRVILAELQQIARCHTASVEQLRRGEPGTPDIVGGKQQVGGKIRLAEWLAFAAGGTDPDLIRIEQVRTAMQSTGECKPQQRVA